MKNISLSGFVLILANIVPIIGVLYFDWEPMDVIFIYWLETLFIGFFNIIKIIFVPKKYIIYKFISISFFIFIFTLFQGFQGIFIFKAIPGLIEKLTGEYIEISIIGFAEYLFWPALALFLSHLFSLIWNFFLKKEYKTVDTPILLFQPMQRVAYQQIFMVGGGFALAASNSPFIFMIFIILVKIYLDLKAHLKSHQSPQEVEPDSA